MKKEVRKEIIVMLLALVAIVSLAVFISATIEIADPFIDIVEIYGPGQAISGIATFSLDDEPGDTIVKGQIGSNSVSMLLQEFLDENEASYSCEPSGCSQIFILSNPTNSKDISFSDNEGMTAIRASGNEVNIQSLEFFIEGTSSGAMVCGETPLRLDLLDDEIIDWEYKEPGAWCGSIMGKNYNPGAATEEKIISATTYCEKIEIDKTGKIMINAEVRFKEGEPGDDDLIYSIYNGAELIAQCSPGKVDNTEYLTKNCEIPEEGFYVQEKQDFFICIKNSGSAEYAIKSESESPFSGFWGAPPQDVFTTDYALSVLVAGFSPFNGRTKFNSTNYLGPIFLKDYVQDYIDSRYGGDCPEVEGCGIPIRFIRTESNQQVTINELSFKFDNSGGPGEDFSFYDFNIEYPDITMAEKSLAIDALNITVPDSYGTYTFSFTLGTETESADFEVAQVPTITNLIPRTIIPGTETTFEVTASSPKGNNIVSYEWDFGDGSTTRETVVPQIKHTYMTTGTFSLIVSAVDTEDLKGTRSFTISATITKEGLNSSIKNKQAKISTFRNNLVEWYSNIIEEKLNLNNTESTLDTLYSQLETATEPELVSIKNQLDSLEIPQRIDDSLVFDESIYIPAPNIIRPDLVENLGGGGYNNELETEYLAGIIDWYNNQDVTIEGAVKTIMFDDATTQDTITLTIIDVSLAQAEEAYLIINLPIGVDFQELSFKEDYGEQEIENSIAIILDTSETIEFVMPDGQQISNIELFLAPNLDSLGIQPGSGFGEQKVPWFWAIFFIIIILLGILAALYFIWHGKKAKIKKELFRNPMDLFNLTNFIKNARLKGMNKKEIEEKLKKTGWTKKQIDFAFSKIK